MFLNLLHQDLIWCQSVCGSDFSVKMEIVPNSFTYISSNTTYLTISTTSTTGSMSSTTASITAENSCSTLCAEIVLIKSFFGSSTFSYSASVSERSTAVDSGVVSSASSVSRVIGGGIWLRFWSGFMIIISINRFWSRWWCTIRLSKICRWSRSINDSFKTFLSCRKETYSLWCFWVRSQMCSWSYWYLLIWRDLIIEKGCRLFHASAPLKVVNLDFLFQPWGFVLCVKLCSETNWEELRNLCWWMDHRYVWFLTCVPNFSSLGCY